MPNDPFASLTSDESAPLTESADPAGFFGFEEVVGGEDYIPPTVSRDRFIKPAEGAIVPVRIASVDVVPRTVRLVVIEQEGKRPLIHPKAVDEALEAGAIATVVEQEIPRFEVKADLEAECYGDKGRPYLLGMPALSVKMAFKNKSGSAMGKEGKKLGFPMHSGVNLMKATRVVEKGDRLRADPAFLKELAEKMIGKVVMAQIKYVERTYTAEAPRKDSDGNPVRAEVDEHGSFVKVYRALLEDGAPAFTDDGVPVVAKRDEESALVLEDGSPYKGAEDILIADGHGVFLVSDKDGAVVTEPVPEVKCFDNLRDDVAAPPDRIIRVLDREGSMVAAEVTLDTLGRAVGVTRSRHMAPGAPVPVGAMVQAARQDSGEVITATWLGTTWQEMSKPYALSVTEEGELRLTPEGEETGGLDVFKGD